MRTYRAMEINLTGLSVKLCLFGVFFLNQEEEEVLQSCDFRLWSLAHCACLVNLWVCWQHTSQYEESKKHQIRFTNIWGSCKYVLGHIWAIGSNTWMNRFYNCSRFTRKGSTMYIKYGVMYVHYYNAVLKWMKKRILIIQKSQTEFKSATGRNV